MSEARKKAKQKAAGETPPAALPPAAVSSDSASPDSVGLEADPGTESREEEGLVFPAEPRSPEPSVSGRFELPSSGLAEDILAREAEIRGSEEAAPVVLADAVVEAPALPREEGRAQSISFFSAPSRESRAAAEEMEHLATFFLDKEEYGVDVRLVQEIRRVTEITQVPRAPEFIKGVINLRGRIIPVIDLKRKLGLGEVAATKLARIVVVTLRGRLLGLLVDGASQVLKVPVSLVEPAPEEVMQKGGDYLRGVAKLEKRLIILVDLETALAGELREGSQAER
jgi:purine-binding chemotaxis protein CheW